MRCFPPHLRYTVVRQQNKGIGMISGTVGGDEYELDAESDGRWRVRIKGLGFVGNVFGGGTSWLGEGRAGQVSRQRSRHAAAAAVIKAFRSGQAAA